MEDQFMEIAQNMVLYKIRSTWLELSKLFNQKAKKHGGTLAMGFVLLALNEREGTPVTRIAPRLKMEPNSLSRILKGLETKGLIQRKKDPEDKRIVRILLTQEGKEMKKVALELVFRLEETISRDLSKGKLKSFMEVMDHVPKAIEKYSQNK